MPLRMCRCVALSTVLLAACGAPTDDLQEGLAAYRAGDYRTAVTRFDRAIAANDRSVEAFLWRGHALANLGDRGGAVEDYERAQALNPKAPEPEYALGYLRAEEGRTTDAIRHFAAAITKDPNHLPSYIERSKGLAAVGQYDAALKDVTVALRSIKDESGLHRIRARILTKMTKFEDAKSDYDRAVDLKPTDANLITERAELHYKRGEYRSALDDLERAVNVSSGAAYPYNNLAWFLVTNPKRELRNGQRALGLVREALAKREGQTVDAMSAAFLGTQAAVFAELGDFKSARELQRKCIALAEKLKLNDLGRQQQYLVLYEMERPLVLDRDQTLRDFPS